MSACTEVSQAREIRYYAYRATKHLTWAQEQLDESVRAVMAARLTLPDVTGLLIVCEPDRTAGLRQRRRLCGSGSPLSSFG